MSNYCLGDKNGTTIKKSQKRGGLPILRERERQVGKCEKDQCHVVDETSPPLFSLYRTQVPGEKKVKNQHNKTSSSATVSIST